MNRRQWLTLALASTGAALAPSLTAACGRSLAESAPLGRTARRRDGLAELDLTAGVEPVAIGDRRVRPFSYNGQIPGPAVELRPGETLRLGLTNALPQPTNLHFHGLHVPPTQPADDVFLSLDPGDRFVYEFELPANHPAGLFWYHPHRHGYVADQVSAGLAGTIAVRGELDDIPEVKAAREQILVLQDFAFDRAGRLQAPTGMGRMLGREGPLVTANGQVNPPVELPRDGLLRLRLLNASASRFYRLQLEDHPLYLIATDGGAIAEPVELDEILLAPGERADLLVKGDREPGAYRLWNLPYNRGGPMGRGMMGGDRMGRGPMHGPMHGPGGRGRYGEGDTGPSAIADRPQPIATVTYGDRGRSVPLPDRLLPVEALPEPAIVRQFDLSHGMAPGRGMVFLINGQVYDGDRIDARPRTGTVEDWDITNTGVMDHPFHIHVNSFQVLSRNGRPEPFRAWKDTVRLSPGERLRLRIPFRDYAGKTVFHCHVLDHEDLGMMGNLAIDPGDRSV